MSRLLSICLLAGCEILSLLAVSHSPQSTSMEGARANVSKATIEGLVRDVACPIQNLVMPFVGKYVRASGIVFERTGTHAIVITEIKEVKEVHVTFEGSSPLRES